MQVVELDELMQLAEDFWPKAMPAELGLLRKLAKSIEFNQAKDIIEDAKLESRFSSLPLNILKNKMSALVGKKQSFTDFHCTCVYVGGLESGWKPGVRVDVCIKLPGVREADSAEEVLNRCRYWLGKEYGDATAFEVYVDNHSAAMTRSHNLQMEDPEKRRQYADYLDTLEASKNRRLAATVAESLPEIPKEPIVNTQAVAKEMVAAVLDDGKYYDTDNPDELSF